MGWRYVFFTSGALVLVLSILRVTIVRLKETPKYQLAEGNDVGLIENLQSLAKRYNRPCSLTLEQLEACGKIQGTHGATRFSLDEFKIHISGLFATRKIGLSTSLIWLSWTLIGLACVSRVFHFTQEANHSLDIRYSMSFYRRFAAI
jgi:hypothetical protein